MKTQDIINKIKKDRLDKQAKKQVDISIDFVMNLVGIDNFQTVPSINKKEVITKEPKIKISKVIFQNPGTTKESVMWDKICEIIDYINNN